MRREVFLILSAAILLAHPAWAGVAPIDAAVLEEPARMHFHAVVAYSSTDARAQRESADSDGNGTIEDAEARDYEIRETASRLGNASSNLRWDGTGAVWADVAVTAERFVHRNFNTAFSLVVDGTLSLAPAAGPNHTLIISNLTAFSNYSFSLVLPPDWSITSVVGVFVTYLSPTAVFGFVDPGSLAFVRVTESPAVLPPDVEAMNLSLLVEIARLNATLLEELARTNTTLFGALAAHDAGLIALLAAQNASLLASMAASDAALAAQIGQTNASLLASLAAQNRSLLQAIAASNATLLAELARVNATLRDQIAASNRELWDALNASNADQASALASTRAALDETNASMAQARAEAGAANRLALLGLALGAAGIAVAVAALFVARRAINRFASGPGEEFDPDPPPVDFFSPYQSEPSRGHSMAAEGEIGAAGDHDP